MLTQKKREFVFYSVNTLLPEVATPNLVTDTLLGEIEVRFKENPSYSTEHVWILLLTIDIDTCFYDRLPRVAASIPP